MTEPPAAAGPPSLQAQPNTSAPLTMGTEHVSPPATILPAQQQAMMLAAMHQQMVVTAAVSAAARATVIARAQLASGVPTEMVMMATHAVPWTKFCKGQDPPVLTPEIAARCYVRYHQKRAAAAAAHLAGLRLATMAGVATPCTRTPLVPPGFQLKLNAHEFSAVELQRFSPPGITPTSWQSLTPPAATSSSAVTVHQAQEDDDTEEDSEEEEEEEEAEEGVDHVEQRPLSVSCSLNRPSLLLDDSAPCSEGMQQPAPLMSPLLQSPPTLPPAPDSTKTEDIVRPPRIPVSSPMPNLAAAAEDDAMMQPGAVRETPVSEGEPCIFPPTPRLTPPASAESPRVKSSARDRWNPAEHELFLEGLQRFGRKWTKIQSLLPHKSAAQIRVHAYSWFGKMAQQQAMMGGVMFPSFPVSPSPVAASMAITPTAKASSSFSQPQQPPPPPTPQPQQQQMIARQKSEDGTEILEVAQIMSMMKANNKRMRSSEQGEEGGEVQRQGGEKRAAVGENREMRGAGVVVQVGEGQQQQRQ